ncbi:MAG TPA: orotidine-5'-phosphate decarboxylase [Acidobacteriota bacterium]|nr:orotidine-5'-phosphate decarboxylase [Acidobacteriota bacterium]
MNPIDPSQHLIVALDVPTADEALELVKALRNSVGVFKVGLQLYTSTGPRIVEEIQAEDCKVFLDLKLHDIPNTVSKAVLEACKLGVHMLTLHASGGPTMLRGAKETVDEWTQSTGKAGPYLLGVTVLTSLGQPDIDQLGFGCTVEDLVVSLARLAEQTGIDGIVCSPLELGRLGEERFRKLFFVTPGIRPSGSSTDDQARVKGPAEAIAAGAKYLVVGRPITGAPDPVEAAEVILNEIRGAELPR